MKKIFFAITILLPLFNMNAQWNPEGNNTTTGAVFGRSFITQNPNNTSANITLSWLNDIPRLRIGGSGEGAYNGFEIQGVADKTLFKLTSSGNLTVGSGHWGAITIDGEGDNDWTLNAHNAGQNFNLRTQLDGEAAYSLTHLTVNRLSGNVGIGVTNPTNYKLHVAGAIKAQGTNESPLDIVLATPWGDNGIIFNATSSEDLYRFNLANTKSSSKDNNYFRLVYNDDESAQNGLYLKKGGNVGIGTTAPTTNLQVNSKIVPSDLYPPSEYKDYFKNKDYDVLYLNRNAQSNIGPSLFMKGTNNNTSFSARIALLGNGGANGDLAFLTSATDGYNQKETMRITHNGSVGIGTTNPGIYKLAVVGDTGIIAEKVTIKLASQWPDYVFNKEYKLPTLKEVEKQIKEKGHLKNIPSAKEVDENGIELGNISKNLLEKIEELTLYTIQQEKKLEKQNKEIEELKLLVSKLIDAKE